MVVVVVDCPTVVVVVNGATVVVVGATVVVVDVVVVAGAGSAATQSIFALSVLPASKATVIPWLQ
jgi:hypothetical protein